MTTDLSFINNTISTFQYEGFSYRISNSKTPLTVPPVPGIPIGYLTVATSNVLFSAATNIMSAGTQVFTIIDACSNISSNTVTIGPGRFRDASAGNSVSGNSYTFYKGEPIPQIPLYAPFAVSLPTASPILPPGLAFYSVSNGTVYNISGIPTVTSPQSNHLFLGKGTGSNLGKIITSSNVGMVVSNERLLIDVSGSTIVSDMRIDTAIPTRAITARFPPYPSGGTLTYSWSGLPNGIVVKDLSGNIRDSGFSISNDISYTLVLEGAPTLSAAQAFQQAGITSNVVNIVATRTNPAPTLTSNIPFTFAFGPTALFTDNVVTNPLFVNVPLNPLSNYFRAQVYFGAGNITDIDAPYGLPPGLSLGPLVAGRKNLIGTPTTDASSGSYTIRMFSDISPSAIRTVLATINILNDAVTFSSPNDVCYSFIEARPLSNALAGYYPSPIDFKASALSGFPLTFTGSNIPMGIDFSYPSSGTARLVGSTLATSTLNKLRVTATAAISGASSYRDVCYEVLADAITFADVSALMFVQNRPIPPTQFFATSLSERTVVSYTSPNLPTGLALTRTGRLSGTPTATLDTSFTVSASTGFGSPQSKSFNYSITPDSVLLVAVPPVSTYVPGGIVSIDINGVAYSGGVVSNYSLSNFTPSYGLSINSNTGLISGTLTPPLASFKTFYANASVGVVDSSISCTITSILSGAPRTFLINHNDDSSQSAVYYNDTSSLVTTWNPVNTISNGSWITDFQSRNTTLDSNTFLLCYTGYGSNSVVKRSRDGFTFADVFFGGGDIRAYTALNPSNTSTWYIGGSGIVNGSNGVVIYRSNDDGITWAPGNGVATGLLMQPRKSTNICNYYTYNGVALGHSNGVYMIGGEKMMRTTDQLRWDDVGGGFTKEVGAFSMTGPVWVATGSDEYDSGTLYGGVFPTTRAAIKWSDNRGANWSDGTGDVGDFIGYEVAYASNTWLSTAMSVTRTGDGIFSKFLCSSDGKDWSNITLDVSFTVFPENHLPEVGSLWFDGSNWNAVVKLDTSLAKVYSHDVVTPLTTGWTSAGPLTSFDSNAQLKGFRRELLRVGVPENNTFTFASPPTGPRVLSPTERSFIAYQYVPITPITFDVSGTGFIYYFVDAATLPVGITFDPLTASLSGTSVQVGTRQFEIYIRDSSGVTPVSAKITTVIPRVTRQQTGAGGWTSLVRQYTEVNAAQNSVNGKVLPSTEATLGEFMRPEPPDSVSAVSCDKPL